MFIYIQSAENYVDVAPPALEVDATYIFFFLTFMILGLFFITAIVIGVFEDTFTQLNQTSLKKGLLYGRTGAVAAFTLLDLNNDGSISFKEFGDFIFSYRQDLS